MSGWHSLSGYLFQKPAGALSRLKSKRRLWCIFEESQCQLLYYKTRGDKTPLGHIVIKGAALLLDPDAPNQFIIMSEGKEFTFSADNHESLMIWLTGLQAKRDSFVNKITSSKTTPTQSDNSSRDVYPPSSAYGSLNRDRSNSDISLFGRFRKNKVAPSAQSCSPLMSSSFSQSIDAGYALHAMSQLDHSASTLKRPQNEFNSLAPVSEEPRSPKSAMLKGGPMTDHRFYPQFPSNSTSLPAFDNDDVFPYPPHASLISLPTANASTVPSGSPTTNSSRNSEGSNDSAIEKGSLSSLDVSSRLSELERELMLTKCELAKVLNQQTTYAEMIQKKDVIIQQLETIVLRGSQSAEVAKCRRCASKRELEEKARVLKNENAFLNKEIVRMARLIHCEQAHNGDLERQLNEKELELYMWKRDYVSVIQSSIHYPTGDTMDNPEVMLHSQDHHENRVHELLDEARSSNPGLPTYDRLKSSDVHVDSHGFKHRYQSVGLRIHYICTQLSYHYTQQLASFDNVQLQWKSFLFDQRDFFRSDAVLKRLCRMGIPQQYRREVWRKLVYTKVRDVIDEKGPHYFRNLCNTLPDSQIASHYKKQISLDLMRTMPSNVKFSSPTSKGIMDLQDVLLAFCIHNPAVGYCQGINFIVAMALLISDAKDAFWMLVAISEKYFGTDYFSHNLIGAQADQEVLKDIIKEKLPRLHQHFIDVDIEISTITLNWFMAIFFDSVPFETLLRIWDCFLLEGPKVLFRCAVAILRMHEVELLQKSDVIGVMKHLKACAKLTYDVDGLMKTAFEELEPFPRRRDIAIKQTCYNNVLKEKIRKREEERSDDSDLEQCLATVKEDMQNLKTIDCAAAIGDVIKLPPFLMKSKLWLSHGDRDKTSVCEIDCSNNSMHSVSIEMGARILCMLALSTDTICMGTISKLLAAYNTTTCQELWRVSLHDSILSLAAWVENKTSRIFAGLANGNVAVIEGYSENVGRDITVIYLPVGKMAAACVAVRNDHIWCSSGNEVHIIHSRTLDKMDIFTVSPNPYDHVLTLTPSPQGMWISVKGSTVLELWSYATLTCKMLFDTFTCKHPRVKKDEETAFMSARISCVLIDDNTIWVGTGDGSLLIFDLIERCKTPTEISSSCDSSASSPFHLKKKRGFLNMDSKTTELCGKTLPPSPLTQGVVDDRFSQPLEMESKESDWDEINHVSELTKGGGEMGEYGSIASEMQNSASIDVGNGDVGGGTGGDDGVGENTTSKSKSRNSDSSGVIVELSEDCHSPSQTKKSVAYNTEEMPWSEAADMPSSSSSRASQNRLITQDSGILSQTQNSSDDEYLLTFRDKNFVWCGPGDNPAVFEATRVDCEVTDDLVDLTPPLSNEPTDDIMTEELILFEDSGDRRTSQPTIGVQNCPLHPEESYKKNDSHVTDELNAHKNVRPTDMLLVPQAKVNVSDVSEFESTVETLPSAEDDEVFFDASHQDGTNLDACRDFGNDFKQSMLAAGRNNQSADIDIVLSAEKLAQRRELYAQTKRFESIASMPSKIRYTLGSSNSETYSNATQQRAYRKLKCRKRQKKGNTDIDFRLDFSSIVVPTDASSCSTCATDQSESSFMFDSLPDISNAVNSTHAQSCAKEKQFFQDSTTDIAVAISQMADPEFFTLTTSTTPTTVDPWSSYDDANLSTSTNSKPLPWIQKCVSHTPSTISLCSNNADSMYTHELLLQAKMKISDKAIKAIILTTSSQEHVVVTCAGCYLDDEAVLKWKRDKNGRMCTNELIYPVCPVTKETKLPRYMQNSIASLSSVSSLESTTSQGSVICSNH